MVDWYKTGDAPAQTTFDPIKILSFSTKSKHINIDVENFQDETEGYIFPHGVDRYVEECQNKIKQLNSPEFRQNFKSEYIEASIVGLEKKIQNVTNLRDRFFNGDNTSDLKMYDWTKSQRMSFFKQNTHSEFVELHRNHLNKLLKIYGEDQKTYKGFIKNLKKQLEALEEFAAKSAT